MWFHWWNPLSGLYFVDRKLSSFWGPLHSGQTIGHDLRGVKSSGLLWRRVSFRWGAISYQGNSEKSAKIFDKLIDNVCFDEPAMNK
jgi:hypothetical protein